MALRHFDQLKPGEIFQDLKTGGMYVLWRLPGSNTYAGLPLTEDCQGEPRLIPHGEFLYPKDAGQCNSSGIVINNLKQVPPLPSERV